MYDFQRMSVAMLGAGIENIALAKYLLERGAKVVIYDTGDPERLAQRLEGLDNENLALGTNKDNPEMISSHDMFFRSPGMPLEAAKELAQNNTLSSPMQLFFELCPAKIVAVTGTKGKGTTSSLIGSIIGQAKQSGLFKGNNYVMGNIGKAPFEVMNDLTKDDIAVIELSSFQLEDMTKSSNIAVVLDITPDHLAPQSESNPNYHKSFEDYVAAKRRIVENLSEDDAVVLVANGTPTEDFGKYTRAKVYFSNKKGENSIYLENGKIFIDYGGVKKELMSIDEPLLKGGHHLINIESAAMVGKILGYDEDTIKKGIVFFKGLPHRLQFVREVGGVKYFDDSYATGPQPTIAAIKTFNQPLVLILGGSSKGADFSEMAIEIAKAKIRNVILIGDEADNIERNLLKTGKELHIVKGLKTMTEIVELASKVARSGDVVLLSPACTSYGLFQNASDRGDQFINCVSEL